jgi:MFS family permease
MIFAVFTFDREPLQWAELPAALKDWTQGAGGVAAAGLAIWCLAYFLRRRWLRSGFETAVLGGAGGALEPAATAAVRAATAPEMRSFSWSLTALLFAGLTVCAAACYGLVLLLLGATGADVPLGSWTTSAISILLTVGGACAIAAVLVPVLADLARFRLHRIWALARLSLKEALRKRYVWGFSAMALIFLFADWFVPFKPEDQLRNYVRVIYWSLTPLFLLVACWMGSFGIPTEVKNQSIHTIVTKPVERFEIVLGRFLGYGILLSVVLFALTAVSLLYVWRGVREEAKKESYKARVPIYANELYFYGMNNAPHITRIGENVGRVWDYRSYIGGPNPSVPNAPRQYAIWSFDQLPSPAADGSVDFEFSFDIYRLTKGKEDRAVIANFTFADGALSVEGVQRNLDILQQERAKQQAEIMRQADAKRNQGESPQKVLEWQTTQLDQIQSSLAAKFGVYELSGPVLDYHTQALGGDNPKERKRVGLQLAKLFEGLSKNESRRVAAGRPTEGRPADPALKVLVSVAREHASAAQKLGMARPDLYVLADTGPFWLNFIKGIIGMWFTIMLILGIAVTCSTYFSGIISLLVTVFLVLFGFAKESFVELVQGKVSGPLEAAWRLLGKKPSAVRLDEAQGADVLRFFDEGYRRAVRLVLNVFPDVNRYDLQQYVANGFDISWSQVLFLDNFVPLVGYILPCAVLAYYLMRFREVANPT